MEGLALIVAEIAVTAAGSAAGYLASAIIKKVNDRYQLDLTTSRNCRKLSLLLRGTSQRCATPGTPTQWYSLMDGTPMSPQGKSEGPNSAPSTPRRMRRSSSRSTDGIPMETSGSTLLVERPPAQSARSSSPISSQLRTRGLSQRGLDSPMQAHNKTLECLGGSHTQGDKAAKRLTRILQDFEEEFQAILTDRSTRPI